MSWLLNPPYNDDDDHGVSADIMDRAIRWAGTLAEKMSTMHDLFDTAFFLLIPYKKDMPAYKAIHDVGLRARKVMTFAKGTCLKFDRGTVWRTPDDEWSGPRSRDSAPFTLALFEIASDSARDRLELSYTSGNGALFYQWSAANHERGGISGFSLSSLWPHLSLPLWRQRRSDAMWVRDCHATPISLPDDTSSSSLFSFTPDVSPVISAIRHWPHSFWIAGLIPTALEVAPYAFGLISSRKWCSSVTGLFGVWAGIERHRIDLLRTKDLPPDIADSRRARRQNKALDMLKPLRLARDTLFPLFSAPSEVDRGDDSAVPLSITSHI
jgi:hypothetical protein